MWFLKERNLKDEAALLCLKSTLGERATVCKWVLQENHFSNRFDTSCNGFTLAWQANGLALMVLPIEPQFFCCCANTFLSFFIWPPANYTCYFCLGNLLSWKRKYETTFQRKALRLFGWPHQDHELQGYQHKAFSDQMEIFRGEE